MQFIERHTEFYDWLIWVFILCALLIAVARWNTLYTIRDLLESLVNSKFISITQSYKNNSIWLFSTSIILYTITLSLIIHLFYSAYKNLNLYEYKTFILITTLVAAFLISKYLIEKVVHALFKSSKRLEIMMHHKLTYRCALGYVFFMISLIGYFLLERTFINAVVVTGCAAALLILYNLIVAYKFRALFVRKWYYFILYLCTLEIAPYLLLYKVVIAQE